MRFSANLSMLYQEHAFLDRFNAAAADGFRGVEFVSAYDFPIEVVVAAAAGVEVVLFNSPAGDWAAGERGCACQPGEEARWILARCFPQLSARAMTAGSARNIGRSRERARGWGG